MRILLLLVACTVVLVAQNPVAKQSSGTEVKTGNAPATGPEWRRNVVMFDKQIFEYLVAETKKENPEFPGVSMDFMKMGGEVSHKSKVMQTYSQPVEWEGTFMGVDEGGARVPGRPKRIRVKLADLATYLIYPAESAIPAWSSLEKGSKVKFRATIEGIAGAHVFGGHAVFVSLKEAVPSS